MNMIDVEEAVSRLTAGEMIILTDKHDRENEGDILVLADRISCEHIDFMTKHARGLICVPLSSDIADRLQLQPMVSRNNSVHETAFTISVDAANGGTGISVSDRTETVRRLADPASVPESLARPGHIFPIIAKDGGVMERDGHTEASVELARLCGAAEAGVICEILSEGEGMARGDELQRFAAANELGILSISDLKDYLTEPEAESHLPAEAGDFVLRTYRSDTGGEPVVTLVSKTEPSGDYFPVRIHSECLTGDVFGSLRCDCGAQLKRSLEYLSEKGGMLIYLRQEGRGIGLTEKVRAYDLQENGADTWEANIMLGYDADERDYERAVSILRKTGRKKIALLTNNPDKIESLSYAGFDVRRIPLEIEPGAANYNYLKAKKYKFGHMILKGETA